MSRYSMNGAEDILRLEKQNDQKTYDLNNELSYFEFKDGDKLLDAGCGSGLVTRSIAKKHQGINIDYHACDYSEIAVESSKIYFNKENINVRAFVSPLEKIQSDSNHYDKIICRYVFEHMKDPGLAAKEFLRILKPGGKAFIIDLDGIVFNLYTNNKILNSYLRKLENEFKFDLFIGRKIPNILETAGFTNIKWEASVMCFNSLDEINREIENYKMRFNSAKATIIAALGSENYFIEFRDLYLSELSKNNNTLFYNKFYVTGEAHK